MLPGGMTDMVDRVSHGYNTRGARSNFFIDRSDSKSLKSIAPKIWNSLPSNMKDLTSIASFKEKSKAFWPPTLFVCTVRGFRSCVVPA